MPHQLLPTDPAETNSGKDIGKMTTNQNPNNGKANKKNKNKNKKKQVGFKVQPFAINMKASATRRVIAHLWTK